MTFSGNIIERVDPVTGEIALMADLASPLGLLAASVIVAASFATIAHGLFK